jgi:hypothetical protein
MLPSIKRKAGPGPALTPEHAHYTGQHGLASRASSPFSMPDSLEGDTAELELKGAQHSDGAQHSSVVAQALLGMASHSTASMCPSSKRPRVDVPSPVSAGHDGDTVSIGGSSIYSAAPGIANAPPRVYPQSDTAALAGALDLARVQARTGNGHLAREARLLSEYLQDNGGHFSHTALRSAQHSSVTHCDYNAQLGGTKRVASEGFDASFATAENLSKLSNESVSLAVEAAAASSSVSALLPQVLQQSLRGDITGALHALGSTLQSVVSRQARLATHMLHLQQAATSVLHVARVASLHAARQAGSVPPTQRQPERERPASPPPASVLSAHSVTAPWRLNVSAPVSEIDAPMQDMSPLPGPALGALPSVGSASVGAVEEVAEATAFAGLHTGAVQDSPNFRALFSAVDQVISNSTVSDHHLSTGLPQSALSPSTTPATATHERPA